MRRLLPLILAAVAVASSVTGCAGESEPAGPVLQQTADRLGSIRSGDLSFHVEVDPKGDGDPFGFDVEGPFGLGGDGALPKLDIEYTQTANGQSETVRLVSDGERAIAEAGGRTVELSEAQLEQLRSAGSALGDGGGLEEVQIEGWLVDPKRSDGPDGTDKIEGELDVVALTNGLLEIVAGFNGSEAGTIGGAEADRLRDAVESADFEILTGKDDRLLRKLSFDVSLGVDVPEALRDALGNDVVGAEISFLLELDRPNEPVKVTLPSG